MSVINKDLELSTIVCDWNVIPDDLRDRAFLALSEKEYVHPQILEMVAQRAPSREHREWAGNRLSSLKTKEEPASVAM